MRLTAHSLLTSVTAPPIAEAQRWIEGRVFPPEKPLIDLCQAAPSYPPPDELTDRLASALKTGETHRYTDVKGLPGLRTALADDINQVYAPARGRAAAAENVLITAGCNQAFCLVAGALAKAGDEIILPLPYYFNHQMWLEMNGVTPRYAAFRPDEGGAPDLSEIRCLINPRTRALVLITPNNPTGLVYPAPVLEAAFDMCKAAGIALVLDETYRDFMPHDDAPHRLFQRNDWRSAFVHLYSFSKVFCLTGYRVGAIVADPKLIDEISKAMDCIAICAPTIGQVAAEHGLRFLERWRSGNSELMRARLAAFTRAFARSGIGYEIVSAGAYFAYVKHPHAGQSSHAVARRLADRQNLLALPGSMFGPGQDDYLRLAFANVDVTEMPEIVVRLAADAAVRDW